MVSDSNSDGEAWDDEHPEPWNPYVLHYDKSFWYGGWTIHKSFGSNGWYGQKFINKLPTIIQCGSALLEDPPTPPTEQEEPDVGKRRSAFMIGNVLPSIKKAVMAYRAKY